MSPLGRALAAIGVVVGFVWPQAAAALPAFPGAEGHGSDTPGGRGGTVIAVTNLNDSGPGSLRAALATPGPRIVVFRTGGTIVLQSTLQITQPHLTIAGQTAPGDGILIRNDDVGSGPADSFPSIRIATHDVVIRYLRVRPGMMQEDATCTALPPAPCESRCQPPGDIRAIDMDVGARDIVLDHVSASWASDETLASWGTQRVTVQWSIFGEGLNYMLYDPSGSFHGTGELHAGPGVSAPSGPTSVHHNLWAHYSARMPQVAATCADPLAWSQCASDVVNNVVYDWKHFGTHLNNLLGHGFFNAVGNYYKAGPSRLGSAAGLSFNDWADEPFFASVPGARIGIHFSDNVEWVGPLDTDVAPSTVQCGAWDRDLGAFAFCDAADYAAPVAFTTPPITTHGATAVFDLVLDDAGASIRLDANGTAVPARDPVDARLVQEVRDGTGGVLEDPPDFPGWPAMDPGTPYADGDGDGMPDAWETTHGLDPFTDDGALDGDSDGYTHVEEFLNRTDPNAP